MGETLADLFEWQKPSVGWMSRYFGAQVLINQLHICQVLSFPPVSPYICHIKVANAPKHTTRAVSNLIQFDYVQEISLLRKILNENWPWLYSLRLAHLFPITFRHSNIETEFHIKVT